MDVSKQQLAFYEELINIQTAYRKKLGEVAPLAEDELFPTPDKNQALERTKNGLPLISFEGIKIKEGIIKEILDDVCNVLIKHNIGKKEEIESVKGVEPEGIKKLLEETVLGDKKCEELSHKAFIFINVARPIFESMALKLKDMVVDELWQKDYCPICGGKPLMARLQKEDGKRLLQCSICSTKWQFMRIKCVYCESEDQNDLGFFWADDSSPYRVDFCNKCKGYIKTIDERKVAEGSEPNLFIDDIATAYLDILAAKEGYHSR